MPDLTTKYAFLERIVTATENLLTNIPEKFSKYLPLSGGTMTGVISRAGVAIQNTRDDSWVAIAGGSAADKGAFLRLDGINNTGRFTITARDENTNKSFLGYPDGTLTWDGQPIQTSSDKRLKQDFADVPAAVLKAWGKVEWKQFKFIADVDKKGDSCRWHTGLVAQDVKEVGEKNKVDLCKYGILCHEVREATEERDAVDLWTVRYEEALAMEVIYLRNEIKKLHAEIRKLK